MTDHDLLEERLRQTFTEVAESPLALNTSVERRTVGFRPATGFPRRMRIASIAFVLAVSIAVIVLVFAAGPFSAKGHSQPASGGSSSPKAQLEAAVSRTLHENSYTMSLGSGVSIFYDRNATEELENEKVIDISIGNESYVVGSLFNTSGRRVGFPTDCVVTSKYLEESGASVYLNALTLVARDLKKATVDRDGTTFVVTLPKKTSSVVLTVENGLVTEISGPNGGSPATKASTAPMIVRLSDFNNHPSKLVVPRANQVESFASLMRAGCPIKESQSPFGPVTEFEGSDTSSKATAVTSTPARSSNG